MERIEVDSVMKGTPWLSVLVPVFNSETYLAETAASILSQVDDGVEVVLDNAPSRDGSAKVVASLAEKHPGHVRVTSPETNRGLSAARNDLLSVARGEYVWFIDADDLMEPGAMSALKAIVERHHPDYVMCDYRDFVEGKRRRGRRYHHVPTFAGPSEVPSE